MGFLTAVVFAAQVVMGFLPNIELVTLLFILYTLVLGKKSISYYLCICISGRNFSMDLVFGGLIISMSGRYSASSHYSRESRPL